jgi:hypothetical protein
LKKQKKYEIYISTLIILGLFFTAFSYYLNLPEIIKTFQTIQEAWLNLFVITIKIVVVFTMGIFLLLKWFKQDKQYFSDIPFLFSSFFIILVFAKFFDLLIISVFYQEDPNSVLLLIKTRFILGVFNLVPMLYLSIGMILFYLSLNEKYKKLRDNKEIEKIRNIAIMIIIIIESSAIIFAPRYEFIVTITPLLVIPSLIMIIWMFLFANRNEKLSNVNTLIIATGFILYLFSTIFRSVGQNYIVYEIYFALSELFETLSFLVIFTGILKKSNY